MGFLREEIERKREHKNREITDSRQQLMQLEKDVQNLWEKKVSIFLCLHKEDHVTLIQLTITESMRRREGLVEQKAGLVSANETLEKEVKVSYVIPSNYSHTCT